MNVSIQINIKLPVKIEKREEWYVSSCPVLDVFSQGNTEAEAKRNLEEALAMFLASCFERGTLDDVLRECGFDSIQSHPMPDALDTGTSMEDHVDIPLYLLARYAGESQCHA